MAENKDVVDRDVDVEMVERVDVQDVSSVSRTQHIFTLGNARFLAITSDNCKLQAVSFLRPSLATAITVLKPAHFIGRYKITEQWLRDSRSHIRGECDVFRKEFLEVIVLCGVSEEQIEITPSAGEVFRKWRTKQVVYLNSGNVGWSKSCRGPSAIINQKLIPVLRLFDDTQEAFVTTTAPKEDGTDSFSSLDIAGNDTRFLSVAVPSRLFDSPGLLSGVRIAVKDNFQIKGLKTSLCNRAYNELYPPRTQTAKCVQKLINQGAVILGTTKLASFAGTEEPCQCIDFAAPWNPRADGYQSPAGSSSGSGVAAASYDWVDITIGSDTSGSGRRPGHWNGCFAMRPTIGAVPMEGFIPSFELFDTPTFFFRDIKKIDDFADIWYADDQSPLRFNETPFVRIIYPSDFLPISNAQQQLLIDSLITDLEPYVAVKHSKISFVCEWSKAPPEEALGMGLMEYMKDAARDSFWYDDYHNFDQFREDYRQKFGKEAYISPPTRRQWESAKHISKIQRDEAIKRLEVYRKWFLNKIMTPDTLVVLPIEEISPRYRDEMPLPFPPPTGVSGLMLSPVLGAPELTIPVGQVPYTSKVTGKTEYLPVGVSLLASAGDDMRLIYMATNLLRESGRPSSVFAGRSMFQRQPITQ